MTKIVIFAVFYFAVFPKDVQAYLDPGTGSYLTQIAIGFLVGGVYVGKKYFQQITSFFKNLFQRKSKDEQKSKS